MEKFSSWRDKGTGISPFMPVPLPLSQEKSAFKRTLLLVVKVPLFIIKLPFFILFTLAYYITSLKPLANFVFFVLFGFKNIDFSVEGVKKSNIDVINKNKPSPNDIIVANYSSPIDGLIYALVANTYNWHNVKFLVPNQLGELFEYSLWSLVNHSFDNSVLGSKVESLSSYKNKVVFLLLEGTTSNNKALLPFVPLSPNYNFDGFAVKTLVLKISPGYLTMPIPVSKLGYLFELLTNLNKLTLNYIKLKCYKFDKFEVVELRKTFALNSLNSIDKNLNIAEKQKFVAYYKNHDVKKTD